MTVTITPTPRLTRTTTSLGTAPLALVCVCVLAVTLSACSEYPAAAQAGPDAPSVSGQAQRGPDYQATADSASAASNRQATDVAERLTQAAIATTQAAGATQAMVYAAEVAATLQALTPTPRPTATVTPPPTRTPNYAATETQVAVATSIGNRTADAWGWFLIAGMIVSLAALAVMAGAASRLVVSRGIEAEYNAQAALVEAQARAEAIVIEAQAAGELQRARADNVRAAPRQELIPAIAGSGPRPAISRSDAEPLEVMPPAWQDVVDFLELAERAADGTPINHIPPAQRLETVGLFRERRQQVVNALARLDLLVARPGPVERGGGTYLTRHSRASLIADIHAGIIALPHSWS